MNFYLAISCLLAFTASISADGLSGLAYAPAYHAHTIPRYSFEYSVKDPSTRDNKQQWEKREGDGVRGSYSLREPGGAIRTVDYWADSKSGFNAIIRREGPKIHPPTLKVAQIVKAPLFAPAVGALDIGYGGYGAPTTHLGAAPLYGISSASVSKISAPIHNLPLAIAAAPIAAAPIIAAAPYKTLVPLPLIPNHLPSLGSLGAINKFH